MGTLSHVIAYMHRYAHLLARRKVMQKSHERSSSSEDSFYNKKTANSIMATIIVLFGSLNFRTENIIMMA